MTEDEKARAAQDPENADGVDPNNDPFDKIEDENVRAEAKKFRGIAQRKDKPKADPEIKPTDTKDLENKFVTKEDLAKRVTSEAKAKAPAEVLENWDELMKIPLGGVDPLDADSIVENMSQRLVIFNSTKGAKDKKVDTTDLTSTKANGTGTGKAPDAKTEVKLPGYGLPAQPDSWYPKKS